MRFSAALLVGIVGIEESDATVYTPLRVSDANCHPIASDDQTSSWGRRIDKELKYLEERRIKDAETGLAKDWILDKRVSVFELLRSLNIPISDKVRTQRAEIIRLIGRDFPAEMVRAIFASKWDDVKKIAYARYPTVDDLKRYWELVMAHEPVGLTTYPRDLLEFALFICNEWKAKLDVNGSQWGQLDTASKLFQDLKSSSEAFGTQLGIIEEEASHNPRDADRLLTNLNNLRVDPSDIKTYGARFAWLGASLLADAKFVSPEYKKWARESYFELVKGFVKPIEGDRSSPVDHLKSAIDICEKLKETLARDDPEWKRYDVASIGYQIDLMRKDDYLGVEEISEEEELKRQSIVKLKLKKMVIPDGDRVYRQVRRMKSCLISEYESHWNDFMTNAAVDALLVEEFEEKLRILKGMDSSNRESVKNELELLRKDVEQVIDDKGPKRRVLSAIRAEQNKIWRQEVYRKGMTLVGMGGPGRHA